jgi:hypothetical protein
MDQPSFELLRSPLERTSYIPLLFTHTPNVPGGKVSILGDHSVGHSKKRRLYELVSYSERFPRWSYLNVQLQNY